MKKQKKAGKRYRKTFVRVEHHRDSLNSSYSSLFSNWETINSEDEKIRNMSVVTKEGQLDIRTPPNIIDNPFTVKEESREDGSRVDEVVHKINGSVHRNSLDEESDDD